VELTRKHDDIPNRTKNRLAEEILENRQKVEKNILVLEEVGAAFIEVIATLQKKASALSGVNLRELEPKTLLYSSPL
jgi:hypothetical protein